MKIKREKFAGLLIMVMSVLVLVGAFYFATQKEEPANAAGGRYSKADLANMKEWYYSQAEAPAGCKTLEATVEQNTRRGMFSRSYYTDGYEKVLAYVTSEGFIHIWCTDRAANLPIGQKVTIYWR